MASLGSRPQRSFGVDVRGGGSFGLYPPRQKPATAPAMASSYGDASGRHSADWLRERCTTPCEPLHLSPPRKKLQPGGLFELQFTPEPQKSAGSSPPARRGCAPSSHTQRSRSGQSLSQEQEEQEPTADSQAKGPIQIECNEDFWHAQLDAIYCRRNPHKRKHLAEFLEKYKGEEAILYRKVCEKYDLCPTKFYADPKAWMELEGDVLEEKAVALAQTRPGWFASAISNLMSKVLCRRSAVDAAGLCSQDAAPKRRRLTLLLGAQQSLETASAGQDTPTDLFGSNLTHALRPRGHDTPCSVNDTGGTCHNPSVLKKAIGADTKTLADAVISRPTAVTKPLGADAATPSPCKENPIGTSGMAAPSETLAGSHGRSCETQKRRRFAIAGGGAATRPRAEEGKAATGSTSAFAFRFATGSAVFGQLGARQPPIVTQALVPPSSRPDVQEVNQPVKIRRASSAVLAQRRIVRVPVRDNGGLNMHVRAELKRKADRFEGTTTLLPGKNQEQLNGFLANKAKCFESIPSPSRTSFTRATYRQAARGGA